MIGCDSSLSKFTRTEMTQRLFFNHHGMEFKKRENMWKLNSALK